MPTGSKLTNKNNNNYAVIKSYPELIIILI